MKTVHLFYLNLFGLVLVLSRTEQHSFAVFPTVCKLTKTGHEYAGPVNITRSGRICQRWDSYEPHEHRYRDSALFPDGSAQAAGNKCRNPEIGYDDGVWCYTTSEDRRWENCDVKFCDCKLTKAGHEYAGPLSRTRSGLTCQRWDSNEPHEHRFRNSTLFPDGSAQAAGNQCRNPEIGYDDGVWCYTTSKYRRWEECDVKLCDCKLTKAGQEYAGPLNRTRSGLTCQRWDSNEPHKHRYRESTLFPDGSAQAAGNQCRNPEIGYDDGVWCYTTSEDRRWEECDVKLCDFSSSVFPSASQTSTSRSPVQTPNSTQQTKPPPITNFSSSVFPSASQTSTSRSPVQTPNSTQEIKPPPITKPIFSGENESISILKVVIPTVGVIAVIFVITAIYIWKRKVNPSYAERNQQAAVALDSTPQQNDNFDCHIYETIHQPKTLAGVANDHNSTVTLR